MATVIDAFLVTLGMDPKDFQTAVKQVLDDQKKLQDESDKTAQHMKEKGEKAANFYSQLMVKAGEFFTFLAGASSLTAFIKEEQELELSSGRLAKNLGITVEKLSAWQNAAIMTEGSAQGLNSSMKSLGGSLIDIEKSLPRSERALKVLQAAGVKGLAKGKKADVLDVMDQLAEKFSKMQGFEAGRLGSRIGLDEATIRILKLGKDGLAELMAEAESYGVITKQNVEASNQLNEAEDKLTVLRTQLGREVMHLLLPALTKFNQLLGALAEWAKKHPEAVKVAFIGIGTALAFVAVKAALAALAMLPISLTVYAIAAAIGVVGALIGWVYLEWKKWTEGGQSSLGKLFQFFKDGWDYVKNHVITTFSVIWQTISDYIDVIVAAFKLVWAILTLDGAGIKEAWDKLTTTLGRLMKRLFNYVLYELGYFISTMLDAWNKAWDGMKERARKTLEWVRDWWANLNPHIKMALMTNPVTGAIGMGLTADANYNTPSSSAALRPSLMSGHGSSSSSKSVVIQEMTVNAPLATDAQGIAQGMGQALEAEDLIASLDTGS